MTRDVIAATLLVLGVVCLLWVAYTTSLRWGVTATGVTLLVVGALTGARTGDDD